MVALLHDIIVTAGIYSLVGFEVTPSTVIGFLTILGFSLYDTVVVFDKVDENTKDLEKSARMTYSEAANLAVNQTLMRSINTSVIALLPVAGLLFVGAGLLGVGTLKDLALVLFVGLAAGAYSSIFLATPIVADLKEREPEQIALRRRVMARRSAALRRAGSAVPAGPVASARRARGSSAVAVAERDLPGQVAADVVGRVAVLGPARAGYRRHDDAAAGRPPAAARPQVPRKASPVTAAPSSRSTSSSRASRSTSRTSPSRGSLFRDLTPVFADGAAFRRVIDGLAAPSASDPRAAAVAESGSRPPVTPASTSSSAWRPAGSCWPPPVAYDAGVGVVPVRKAGKLPRERHAADYALEYGTATLELHADSFQAGQRVLIVDDVLATGGTLGATIELVEQAGGVVAAVSVIIELAALGGRERIAPHVVHSLWTT